MGSSVFLQRCIRRRASVQRNFAAHPGHPRAPQALRCWALGVTLAMSLMGPPAAFAAEPDPGEDIASIRTWLSAHNPQLRAMQADADAAEAGILPAGALPDPMASVELDDIDPNHPSLLPGNVGVTAYRLKQRFPLWGRRELSRNVASFEADSMRYQHDATALELLAQAALLEQIEEVAGVRYALGMAERVRPKMMTVVATMAGLLPTMWSTGTGSEVMRRISLTRASRIGLR